MKKRYLIIPVLFITLSILSPLQAFAAYDQTFYSNNNILFYNPGDTNTCSSSNSNAVGSVSLQKSDTLQHIFQTFLNDGFSAVQAAAIMGNLYRESSFNTGAVSSDGFNSYGIAQWTAGRKTNLENFAASQGKPANDLDTQLAFLFKEYTESYKSRLDSSDFATSSDVAAATTAWMVKFESPLMYPANDPGALNSVRIPAAQTIYGFYSSLAPATTSSSNTTNSTGCSAVGNGVVAGNIVKTAIGLAQPNPVPNGTTQLSEATIAFQQAKAQYSPGSDPTDCGGFVTTVMKSSGVDPNYQVGTSIEYQYVQDHPEKYTVIHPKSVADLQPGDILITAAAGHTMIYVGSDGGQYPAVDASLTQRIPSMRTIDGVMYMLSKSDIIAARVIN